MILKRALCGGSVFRAAKKVNHFFSPVKKVITFFEIH